VSPRISERRRTIAADTCDRRFAAVQSLVCAAIPFALVACALAGCDPADPLTVTAHATSAGVAVEANAPLTAVEVRSATGALLVRRALPTPTRTAELAAPLSPGTWVVVAHAGDAEAKADLAVATPPPVTVEVEAAPGQPWVPAEGTIPVPLLAGGHAEVLVGVTGGPDHPDAVAWSGGDPIPLPVAGRREIRTIAVEDSPLRLTVADTAFTLAPEPLALDALRRDVVVRDVAFPCDAIGIPQLGRASGHVTLASPFWTRVVGDWTTGTVRDAWAPWAYEGVTVGNAGDRPVDLVVSLEVRRDGAPADVFRPRLRSGDGDTGTVAALLRVGPHATATAALPVFVDAVTAEEGPYDAVFTVTPLGSSEAIATRTETLVVTRGNTTASLGFGATCLGCLAGLAWAGTRLRRWLEASSTTDLMTIALFGSAMFLVGAASDLLAMGIGAVFGPFAPLLTGLVADVGRYVLLAALVTLLPRPGTLTLALLTGWLLRGLSTGGFTPVDVLYNGISICLCEGFAWLAGLTRGGAWRDAGTLSRWVRLSLGFGGASALGALTNLWLNIVLFRLFFADWYMALEVLVPGFLYTVLACRIGADFAASLRRVSV
jgi:hypothetical protein